MLNGAWRNQCNAGRAATAAHNSGCSQVKELKTQLKKRKLNNHSPVTIDVSSIDGFQGREVDAVIFTTVRNNDKGSVGFLRDQRRMNVALTRARRALIVIGSMTTLSADPSWKRCVLGATQHSSLLDSVAGHRCCLGHIAGSKRTVGCILAMAATLSHRPCVDCDVKLWGFVQLVHMVPEEQCARGRKLGAQIQVYSSRQQCSCC